MADARTLRVAMAGCGTVGCGVGDLLIRDHDALLARTGLDVRLVRAVVRDASRSRAPHVPDDRITTDLAALFRHDTDVVVEVIGGTTVAKEVVLKAIAAGKDVVTANKALIALHGPEIYTAARRAGACVAFEASCAAGLPVIGAIQRGLIANRITAIEGILNGTCNYVLTQMVEHGASFESALADAQRLGYAEADPTLDINGTDTAHKLAILASLAFGAHMVFSSISVDGIDRVALSDLLAGKERGLTCRLLAIGRRTEGCPMLRVRPVFVTAAHPFAAIGGSGNALSVYGDAAGHVMIAGVGAGGASTASGVVSDLVEVGLGNARRTFLQLPVFSADAGQAVPASTDTSDARFYLRFSPKEDTAGASRITSVLRGQGVEPVDARCSDREGSAEEEQDITMLTDPISESRLRSALDAVSETCALAEPPVHFPVMDAAAESDQ